MENFQVTHSLQLVHLDYLIIEVTDSAKDAHVLVITHHLMQYVQALLTSLQTAKCMAQALWDQFVVLHGLLESIVFDHGWNFESDLTAELSKLATV